MTTAISPAFVHSRPAARRERLQWIAYWLVTLFVADEMIAGALWDLLQIEYVRVVMTHLGYPLYVLYIIGAWKLPCAVTMLVPRFPRLKEWAYAGAIFNYTGALASHLLAGDGPSKWIWPAAFAVLTSASWALRPADRRLVPAGPRTSLRWVSWVTPIAITVALVILSLMTLPKGPPPA